MLVIKFIMKKIFYGTGEEIRSWINIKDVVDFINFILTKNLEEI